MKVLDDVVCERRLTKRAADGLSADRAIKVRVGKPRRGKRSWICPFHITGLDMKVPVLAYGEDAVQALLMACEGVRVTLSRNGSLFTWIGGEEGDAGFPMMVDGGMGLAFTKRLEKLVEKEKKRHWKEAAGK